MPVHHASAIPANTLVKQLYSDRDGEDRTGKEGDGKHAAVKHARPGRRPGRIVGMRLHSGGAIDVL